MSTVDNLDTLRAKRDAARADYERLDAEVRAIRAQLTAAERKSRKARKAYETAALSWVEASESAHGR